MNIITVINAKGGCGKSTIAANLAAGLAVRGFSTLLIDMDPQAQVTQWLGAGDGLTPEGTLVVAMEGKTSLTSIIQPSRFENLSFVPSSQGLEELGRQITDMEGYQAIFTSLLAGLDSQRLRTSVALVYQLCARGQIEHERYGLGRRGVIRIREEALKDFQLRATARAAVPTGASATPRFKHITLLPAAAQPSSGTDPAPHASKPVRPSSRPRAPSDLPG